jgi:hypothetical protein
MRPTWTAYAVLPFLFLLPPLPLPGAAGAAGAASAAERWLGELRMARFWPDFEVLGVIDVEDYLLV